jgi:nucleotide-binding universal stress UspA family protein
MKKILVPVDFSKVSMNAVNYAAHLAMQSGTRMQLFYVCFAPGLISTNTTIELPSADQLRREGIEDLEKLKRKLTKRHEGIRIDCECVCGFPVDEIRLYAEKNKFDLIVMGTQGAGFLSERFLGSTTTSLIGHCVTPVLAIDRKVRFRPAKRIVFATDFVETRPQVLKPLKDLAKLFGAEIFILNIVVEPVVAPTMEEMIAAYKLDRSLQNVHHTFFYKHSPHVVESLNDFISLHKMDMVVMVSRRHSFFSRLLQEPHTKQMAFHAKVPVLALEAVND